MPAMHLVSTDFPAPLSPQRAVTCALGRSRSTPCRAWTAPKCLLMPRSLSSGSEAAGATAVADPGVGIRPVGPSCAATTSIASSLMPSAGLELYSTGIAPALSREHKEEPRRTRDGCGAAEGRGRDPRAVEFEASRGHEGRGN